MKTRVTENYSEVGLGAWQLGADWGNVSEDDAHAILQTAADNGVTFIDTADVYGAGLSETRIGKFISTYPKGSFFVATKLGRLHGYPDQYSLQLFRKCVQDSIKRLQVDKLNLVQLHCVPTQVLQKGEVFDWLRTLKKEGLIENFGASVESTKEARICLQQDGLYSLQIIFNIYRQSPISEIFSEAQAKGVRLIVRLPLASGLLSGRFDEKTVFPEDDHRNYNRDGAVFNVGETFAGLPYDKAVTLTKRLQDIVKDQEQSMSSLAIRWVLDHPAISVVIPGATKIEQVRKNAAASQHDSLAKDLHQTLKRFFYDEVQQYIRGPV